MTTPDRRLMPDHYDPTEERVDVEPDDTVHQIMTSLANAIIQRAAGMTNIELESLVMPAGKSPIRMRVVLSAD